MSGLSLSFAAVAVAVEGGGGFNPFEFAQGATFWTVVIFLLALVPMWKFVFGPITAALDERDRKVDEALAAAERARREAEEQTAATRSELEKARAEAKAMIEEATSRAQRQAEAELANAKSEADRQLQQARQEIETQKQKALEDIRREVVDLAVGSAAAVLGRSVESDDNRRIVDEFLTQAGGSGR